MWMKYNFAPAGLRGRVIFGKGNDMEELIRKQSAIDVVREIIPDNRANGICEELNKLPSAELSTNLAEVGTDCISRRAAIGVLRNRWMKTINYEGIGEDIAEECEIYLKTLPSAQPEIIYCKDCRKHNKKIGFDENYHTVWKEDACPLVSWRGKAQGHEFDYQYCVYAERREVTT